MLATLHATFPFVSTFSRQRFVSAGACRSFVTMCFSALNILKFVKFLKQRFWDGFSFSKFLLKRNTAIFIIYLHIPLLWGLQHGMELTTYMYFRPFRLNIMKAFEKCFRVLIFLPMSFERCSLSWFSFSLFGSDGRRCIRRPKRNRTDPWRPAVKPRNGSGVGGISCQDGDVPLADQNVKDQMYKNILVDHMPPYAR